MNRQLSRQHILFLTRFRNEALSKRTALVGSNHPANNVSAENVENHVQVKVSPFHWTEQFRYIPGPDLIRPGGEELRAL